MPAEIRILTQSSELGMEPKMCASQCKFCMAKTAMKLPTESVFWAMCEVRLSSFSVWFIKRVKKKPHQNPPKKTPNY